MLCLLWDAYSVEHNISDSLHLCGDDYVMARCLKTSKFTVFKHSEYWNDMSCLTAFHWYQFFMPATIL